MLTNNYGLPPAVASAMSMDRYVAGAKTDISVTRLIDSPRIQQLIKIHGYGDMDIMDKTAAFIGTALHALMEEGGREVGAMVEKRFYGDFITSKGMVKMSGQIDIYYPKAKTLHDYKSVKSWKLVMDDLSDIENQLNVCAELMRMNGHTVDKVEAVFFILDWMEGNRMRDGYPQNPIEVRTFRLWSRGECSKYILDRLNAHASDMPECTMKDMWARGEGFAVMKKGRKSALKIEPTEIAVQKWCDDNGHVIGNAGIYIEHRKPKYVRCEKYCQVAEHCSQYQKLKGAE